MQIAVELPNDFMALREKQTIEQEMHLFYAFQKRKIMLSKAAQLAGLNHYKSINACEKERVPVIDISKKGLIEELDNF